MFLARSISTVGTRSAPSRVIRLTRSRPARDRIERPGVRPAGLVDLEIRFGGLEQGIVLGCLNVPISRVEHLPGGERLEDRIGQVHILDQGAATVKVVHARGGEDALVEVRAAAVVPDVIGAEHDRGNPENLGPRELRLGDPDARLGGGNDQRSGVREPQGRRKVDRKGQVGRLKGCRFERHSRVIIRRRRRRDRRRKNGGTGRRRGLGSAVDVPADWA